MQKKTVKQGDIVKLDEIDLDPYVWETISEYIEESRGFVFDTCKERGVNECESYFLSLKFLFSALKKFRNKLFREFNSRTDYDRTPLKISVNHLIHVRLKSIMISDSYKFSKEAANGELGAFRTDSAWAVAEYLAEETGVIFHAKVTL